MVQKDASRRTISPSNSPSTASKSPGIPADTTRKTCKAPRAPSTARSAQKRASPSSRALSPAPAGRSSTTPRARSSTPTISRFTARRKEPMAVGHGASRRRAPGSGTSSATATTIARPSATTSASPDAFPCRRASPSAPGGRATGITAIRRSRISSAASTKTRRRSTCSSSTWTGTSATSSSRRWAKSTNQQDHDISDGPATPGTRCSFPTPQQFLDKLHADGSEDQPQSASRFRHSAMGDRLSRDGQGHGHRSGDQASTFPSTSPTKNSPPTT